MADVKTNLRELGVVYFLAYGGHEGVVLLEDFRPEHLLSKCASALRVQRQELAENLWVLGEFSGIHRGILLNSFKLAQALREKLHLGAEKVDIEWLGNDTRYAPCDIRVNGYFISLKEDSFILENMGLYKYLSLMTGLKHKRGLHVFKYFAKKEYEDWFLYAWTQLILSGQNWELKKGRNVSAIEFGSRNVYLRYNDTVSIFPAGLISIEQFNEGTTAVIREKVFSKWIKAELENDPKYLKKKRECAETAGRVLCSFVNENLSHDNIARFLGVRDFEYYYAKSTVNETTVLKVPALRSFDRFFEVESVRFSVPVSQLNIHTKVVNRASGAAVEFRNECRFSHGQLNGTPEAKMYYPRGVDLSQIFFEI